MAFACGVEYEDVAIVEPEEGDPWDGSWTILSVGGVSPSILNPDWFSSDNDVGTFSNSVAIHAERQRYVMRLVWDYKEVDGFDMPNFSTVTYTQEGSYTRGDHDYTLTANNEGTVHVASAIRVLEGFVVGVDFFQAEGMRWAIAGSESGTWERDGNTLRLMSDDGLERQFVSRQ